MQPTTLAREGGPARMPFAEFISTPGELSVGTEAVDRVLHAIRDHLGMDVAFVAEFRSQDRVFRNVAARGRTPIRPGDSAPLEQGYCKRVVDGLLPQLIPDTRSVAAAMALPETQAVPIGSHVSVPIRLADGQTFGTFCCFSFEPDASLCERDLKMMRVFAQLVGSQIDRDMAQQRSILESTDQIARAIASGQPSIVYQPIYDLASSRLAGVESLSRFNTQPYRGPDEWFSEAAKAGMGVELELAAIRTAVRSLGELPADAYLAVNCSPATAVSSAFKQLMRSVSLERVILELTEHDYINDYPQLLSAIAPLRAKGLRIAVDDAGAGYASLRHVLNIQPDLIKLDTSLTRNVDTDPIRRALASALIAFARETCSRIVAEGVETDAELRALRELGASCAQGYFLARPMSLADVLRRPVLSSAAKATH